jgi:hypothetical protein
MSETTDDFLALRGAWQQETQMIPCFSVELNLLRAKQTYEHTVEATERLRFSAWLNTLRDLADRQADERAGIERRFLRALFFDGVTLTPEPEEVAHS